MIQIMLLKKLNLFEKNERTNKRAKIKPNATNLYKVNILKYRQFTVPELH